MRSTGAALSSQLATPQQNPKVMCWPLCKGAAFREPTPESKDALVACDNSFLTLASSARTLILLAHPGDEIACAGLLQYCYEPIVVFATDGLTEAEASCPTLPRQRTLRHLRRQEARTALVLAGVHHVEFLTCDETRTEDLRLYSSLAHLFESLRRVIRRDRPEVILVPAYEGGHPDHDVCSFMGALVRNQINKPVWEMPLYHKSDTGELVYQRFSQMNGSELLYRLAPYELSVRSVMAACYTSQRDCAGLEMDDIECYRPQVKYDYSQPPKSGTVHYLNWHRPVSAAKLCRSFASFARHLTIPVADLGDQRPSRLELPY